MFVYIHPYSRGLWTARIACLHTAKQRVCATVNEGKNRRDHPHWTLSGGGLHPLTPLQQIAGHTTVNVVGLSHTCVQRLERHKTRLQLIAWEKGGERIVCTASAVSL